MKILFIRHPKTQSNISNLWCGRRECQISDIGHDQINQLIDSLKKNQTLVNEITKIYSSPIQRALFLAEKIAFVCNKKPIIDDRLLERELGKLDKKEAKAEDKVALADFELNTDFGLGVEKIKDMYNKRVKPFLNEIIKNSNKNDVIVVVSHSWVGRLFAFYFSKEKDFLVITKAPEHCKIYEYNV
ncbi:MAG: phosphoglycerate mutase family protein [Mycoplasma sp.]